MASKKQNIEAIKKVVGKRGNKVISAGRKTVSGGKKIVGSATRGDIGGVISGVRKTSSGLKQGYKPAKKLAKGVGRKTKNTFKKVKKVFA